MTEKVQPLFNQVYVEPEEKVERRTGVVTPTSMREKPMRGKVLAVGQTVRFIKPGDVVYFRRYAGDPIELELGRELLLIADDDCLGVVLDSNPAVTDDKTNQDNLPQGRP